MKTQSRRTSRPPLEGARQAPFFMRADADAPSDGYTLDGYGAVFNTITVIDSYEGRFREQFASGSMKKSFKENPPIVQFDHGRHVRIGSIPIAELVSIEEDSDPVLAPNGGAHMIARMFRSPELGHLREALAARQVKGMSIRFGVVREVWETADGKPLRDELSLIHELDRTWDAPAEELPLRTLKEVRVPEVGPVVWPAYVETSIDLRSKVIDLGRLVDGDAEQLDLLGRALSAMQARQSQGDDAPHVTEDDSADEHPSEPADAPQATDDRSAGEHPSKPLGRRGIDVTLRSVRDMLLDIQRKDK